MKNKLIILTSILIGIFSVGAFFLIFNGSEILTSGMLSESMAIKTIKNQYQELKQYPSDNLPPKLIKTQKATDGWYVAFIQGGSGKSLFSATCFLIDNQKNIIFQRAYNSSSQEYINTNTFLLSECTPVPSDRMYD